MTRTDSVFGAYSTYWGLRYEQRNALPECSERALLSRTALVNFYSQVKFATIRRFFALPALVLLLATGLVSP